MNLSTVVSYYGVAIISLFCDLAFLLLIFICQHISSIMHLCPSFFFITHASAVWS